MFLSLFLALAYAYMALGADVLHLTHHGTATSLPSRLTVDICWYSIARRVTTVIVRALLLASQLPVVLLRVDRQVHDAVSDMLFAALDPLCVWNVLQLYWPSNSTHSRDTARSAHGHDVEHSARTPA
eukprot:5208467-Pleurochrysis_carterae.AAC.1